MKKVVISSVILVLLLIGVLFYTNIDKKEYLELNKYTADHECTYVYNEDIDGDASSSISNAYIYLDKQNVSKVIYQSLLEKDNITNSVEMQKDVLKMFNNIAGVSYDVYETKKNLVVEVTYNYKTLDIKKIKKELSTLLDEQSVFKNVDKLPITYETLIKYDLKDYKCK